MNKKLNAKIDKFMSDLQALRDRAPEIAALLRDDQEIVANSTTARTCAAAYLATLNSIDSTMWQLVQLSTIIQRIGLSK